MSTPDERIPQGSHVVPLNASQLSLLWEASKEEAYSRREVARLFGLPESRLRSWEKSGFLQPIGEGRAVRYRFQDLIEVRAAKGLLDQGISLQRVRKALSALRASLPPDKRPLASCRILAEGLDLVVRDESGSYQPTTGQTLLEFESTEVQKAIVSELRPPRAEDLERKAYLAYLEALKLEDTTGSEPADIERAYRNALTYDPTLLSAMTNLANLLIGQQRTEEALALYHQALKHDPKHPETLFNLGLHYLDSGELLAAAQGFQAATEAAPAFADAHFNLAMVFEELDRHRDAAPHWHAYLSLEPDGPLATVARRHLEER